MAELIRHSCQDQGRHGFRVSAEERKGRIFFDRGRVIHAELGEDFGLGAVVEMLRAGAQVTGEWNESWPTHYSIHLAPEVLLSLEGGSAQPSAVQEVSLEDVLPQDERVSSESPRVDTRVVRRVRVPTDPPPLPEPIERDGATGSSGFADEGAPEETPSPRSLSNRMAETFAHNRRSEPTFATSTVPRAPVSSPPEAMRDKARAVPAAASRPGPVGPLEPERRSLVAPVTASPSTVRPAATRPAAIRPSTLRPTAPHPSASRPSTLRPTAIRLMTRPGKLASVSPAPVVRIVRDLPEVDVDAQPTTMVRVSARGKILAARGKSAQRLANAAAYIDGLAHLIATDLGRHGRTALHLRGEGKSLLVTRSEVNDIAAALGPTPRLASLLKKAGVR